VLLSVLLVQELSPCRPIHVDLPISAPGAFCYFIEHDSLDAESSRIIGRKGYFNVDPIITLPTRTPFFPQGVVPDTGENPLDDETSGAVLSKPFDYTLDGLIIISVIAKWMGKTLEWERHFAEASRRGYNMLHWAPLQQRGDSGSPYSISDQLSFDKALLMDPESHDGGLEEILGIVKVAKVKYGLGGVMDIVLNHTASDSPWLQENPEAGKWYPPDVTGFLCLNRLLSPQYTASSTCCRT